MLEDLRTTLGRLDAEYQERRAAAEAAARRWARASSTSTFHELEPFVNEREGGRPGRWLREDEAPDGVHYLLGLDSDERVVIARLMNAGHVQEVLLAHRPDFAEAAVYDDAGRGVAVTRARYDDNGRIQELASVNVDDATSTETYTWENRRLRTINSVWNMGDLFPEAPAHVQYTIDYDAVGDLVAVTRQGLPEDPRVTYRRPTSEPSTKKLHAALITRMTDVLGQWLDEQGHAGAAFALALHYDPVDPFDAVPMLGPSEHLAAVLENPQGDVLSALLNPAEWPDFETGYDEGQRVLQDPALSELMEAVHARPDANSPDAGRAALNAVSRALVGRLPAAAPLPVFLAYAVDLQLEDLADNLQTTLASEHRRVLNTLAAPTRPR